MIACHPQFSAYRRATQRSRSAVHILVARHFPVSFNCQRQPHAERRRLDAPVRLPFHFACCLLTTDASITQDSCIPVSVSRRICAICPRSWLASHEPRSSTLVVAPESVPWRIHCCGVRPRTNTRLSERACCYRSSNLVADNSS